MNYLKRCPQCGATLRIPATQSLLLVRCPVCSHSFRFDPAQIDSETSEEPVLDTKEPFGRLLLDLLYAPIDYWKFKREERAKRQSSASSRSHGFAKRLAVFLLFSILGLHIFRGCEEGKVTKLTSEPESWEEPEGLKKPNEIPSEEPESNPHSFDI